MFNYKIKYTKKQNVNAIDDDKAFEMIDNYWRTLSNNGQVVGGFDVFSNGGNIFLTLVLPTEDSLSDKNNNEYVNKYFKELTDIFSVEIIREGVNLEYHISCACENHRGIIYFKRRIKTKARWYAVIAAVRYRYIKYHMFSKKPSIMPY